MATNKIYYTPGSVITFQASGGTVAWTPQNTANNNGRISAVWDRGAGAKPARYYWRLKTRWVATPAVGDYSRAYVITSSAAADATLTDGGIAFGDANVGGEGGLRNCIYLGTLCSDGVDHGISMSGVTYIYERYVGIAVFNAAGSTGKAFTNTATDHIFTLTEVPDDVEAAT